MARRWNKLLTTLLVLALCGLPMPPGAEAKAATKAVAKAATKAPAKPVLATKGKGKGKGKAAKPKTSGKAGSKAAKAVAKPATTSKVVAKPAKKAKGGATPAKGKAGKAGKAGRAGKAKAEPAWGDLDKVHRVRKGDSLWSIARKYDVTAADLRRLNGEKKLRMLHPGQLVLIKKGDPRKAEEVRPFLKDWARLEPGQGYAIKRPDKNYGRPWAIALLRKAIADLHERYPDSSDVFVGDLSGPIGGRIQHHLSHKTGRDVDLAYFLKGNLALDDFVEATPETVDVEKSWQLIESCLRTDSVQYVFMDHGLQPLFRAHAEALGYPTDDLDRLFQYPREATTREGIIRHVKGHADHLHVRFRCPVDDGLCR